ncbi:MAG: hypothetical protein P4L16_01985 [Chlamydiales bacterium]|nr:hypothetical protein [Chlamydiales bacterium]
MSSPGIPPNGSYSFSSFPSTLNSSSDARTQNNMGHTDVNITNAAHGALNNTSTFTVPSTPFVQDLADRRATLNRRATLKELITTGIPNDLQEKDEDLAEYIFDYVQEWFKVPPGTETQEIESLFDELLLDNPQISSGLCEYKQRVLAELKKRENSHNVSEKPWNSKNELMYDGMLMGAEGSQEGAKYVAEDIGYNEKWQQQMLSYFQSERPLASEEHFKEAKINPDWEVTANFLEKDLQMRNDTFSNPSISDSSKQLSATYILDEIKEKLGIEEQASLFIFLGWLSNHSVKFAKLVDNLSRYQTLITASNYQNQPYVASTTTERNNTSFLMQVQNTELSDEEKEAYMFLKDISTNNDELEVSIRANFPSTATKVLNYHWSLKVQNEGGASSGYTEAPRSISIQEQGAKLSEQEEETYQILVASGNENEIVDLIKSNFASNAIQRVLNYHGSQVNKEFIVNEIKNPIIQEINRNSRDIADMSFFVELISVIHIVAQKYSKYNAMDMDKKGELYLEILEKVFEEYPDLLGGISRLRAFCTETCRLLKEEAIPEFNVFMKSHFEKDFMQKCSFQLLDEFDTRVLGKENFLKRGLFLIYLDCKYSNDLKENPNLSEILSKYFINIPWYQGIAHTTIPVMPQTSMSSEELSDRCLKQMAAHIPATSILTCEDHIKDDLAMNLLPFTMNEEITDSKIAATTFLGLFNKRADAECKTKGTQAFLTWLRDDITFAMLYDDWNKCIDMILEGLQQLETTVIHSAD